MTFPTHATVQASRVAARYRNLQMTSNEADFNMSNTLNHTPSRSFDVVSNRSGNSLFLIKHNSVYELSDVEIFIWDKCNGDNSVKDIGQAIIDEYEVNEASAKDDAIHFLNQMKDAELIDGV